MIQTCRAWTWQQRMGMVSADSAGRYSLLQALNPQLGVSAQGCGPMRLNAVLAGFLHTALIGLDEAAPCADGVTGVQNRLTGGPCRAHLVAEHTGFGFVVHQPQQQTPGFIRFRATIATHSTGQVPQDVGWLGQILSGLRISQVALESRCYGLNREVAQQVKPVGD